MRLTFKAFDAMVDPRILVDSPWQTNQHNSKQIKQLAKMMKKHGVSKPIEVVSGTNRIAFGHGRRDAAIEAKFKEYPVVYHTFESEEEERVKVTSDNAIALQSDLNLEAVQGMALDLGPDFDFELFGIDDFKISGVDTLPPDKSETIDLGQQFIVAVKCSSEEDMQNIYEEMSSRGFECKLIT